MIIHAQSLDRRLTSSASVTHDRSRAANPKRNSVPQDRFDEFAWVMRSWWSTRSRVAAAVGLLGADGRDEQTTNDPIANAMTASHRSLSSLPESFKRFEDLVLRNEARNDANPTKHVAGLSLQTGQRHFCASLGELQNRVLEHVQT